MVRSTQSRKVSKKTTKHRTSRKMKGGNTSPLVRQPNVAPGAVGPQLVRQNAVGGARRKVSKRKVSKRKVSKRKVSKGKVSKRKVSKGKVSKHKKKSGGKRRTSTLHRYNQTGGTKFKTLIDKALNNPNRKVIDILQAYETVTAADMAPFIKDCPGVDVEQFRKNMSTNISKLSLEYEGSNPARRANIRNYLGKIDSKAAREDSEYLKLPYINNILNTRILLSQAIINQHGD
jgi:hypothetical protein